MAAMTAIVMILGLSWPLSELQYKSHGLLYR
jgi:hypothetical protein